MSFVYGFSKIKRRRRRKNGHKTIILGYKEGKLIDNENQYAN